MYSYVVRVDKIPRVTPKDIPLKLWFGNRSQLNFCIIILKILINLNIYLSLAEYSRDDLLSIAPKDWAHTISHAP